VCFLNEQEGSFVTYTQNHNEIVTTGVIAISQVLNSKDDSEKRSLLFCLDRYLDPYYGYNLPYFDEIIRLLEKHLFVDHIKVVKEDILQLLRNYSSTNLDYLAENIEEIQLDLLADALYALGNTYNKQYVPIFIKFENHHNQYVSGSAKEALIELSKI
jgi:hypothetical protein